MPLTAGVPNATKISPAAMHFDVESSHTGMIEATMALHEQAMQDLCEPVLDEMELLVGRLSTLILGLRGRVPV